MRYFRTLPYTTIKSNNKDIVVKNLVTRATLLESLQRNIELFYDYSIQEGDTPETVAYKYYGDQYRYWIVLHANQIMNPQWDWPLTNQQFDDYLESKYQQEAANNEMSVVQYTTTTVKTHQKIIQTLDSSTGYLTTKTVDIDEETYNDLVPITTSKTFSDGSTVTYTLDKKVINIYDYEFGLNESKRNIKLIDTKYANSMELQLENLMSNG